MKLFGKYFGKKGKNKLNDKVNINFDGIDKELKKRMFYGDVYAVNSLLNSISESVFQSTSEHNIKLCLNIYTQTWLRTHGGFDVRFSAPSYIKQVLCAKFSHVPPESVEKCVAYSLDFIFKNEPELMKKVMILEMMQQTFNDNVENNRVIQDLYIDDVEYGLVAEKPIFVNGFGGDKEYLSHLLTKDGEKLEFGRICSVEVDNISGPVDMYSLMLPDRSEYLKIYICNYGTRNTNDVPVGLQFNNKE